MSFQLTKRNKFLITPSVLLVIYSFIKLVGIMGSYADWKNSLFSELMINAIIDSIIMIGLGLGLIFYCGTSNTPESTNTAGEWVDSDGTKWRRTNGGGLFWWDGDEWKLVF